MKIKIVGLLLLFTLAACKASPTMTDAKGHQYSMNSLQGKWLVLNYWATWCNSCLHEIPTLNQFNRDIQGKNIVFLSVNFDGLPTPQLQKLSHDLKIDYPILTKDPKEYYDIGELTGLPVTFIINPEGKVVDQLLGVQSEQTLMEAIEKEKVKV